MKNHDKLIKKVELFERLATYGDRRSFLRALAQKAGGIDPEDTSEVPFDQMPVPPPPAVAPTPVAVAPVAKPVPAGPSIDPASLKNVQNYVNQAMLDKWPPVAVDGKWGPETARALMQWGKTQGLNVGVQQLLDTAKARAMGAGVVKNLENLPTPNLEALENQ
jgi:hypothetical protein